MEQGKIMEAEAPTVWVGAIPTGLMAPAPPQPPQDFLQAGCPSCRPTNSIKAKNVTDNVQYLIYETSLQPHFVSQLMHFFAQKFSDSINVTLRLPVSVDKSEFKITCKGANKRLKHNDSAKSELSCSGHETQVQDSKGKTKTNTVNLLSRDFVSLVAVNIQQKVKN